MKRILTVLLCVLLCGQTVYAMPLRERILYEDTVDEKKEDTGEEAKSGGDEAGLAISAQTGVIMEASTGKVLFEKEADAKLPPASVTKVMTLLLIFDALDSGQIKLEDSVTTSEYAASMGGSQVFLEPGETQTVDTMIKCISVASANDACVALKNGRQISASYREII